MEKKKLDRIGELSRKQRSVGLTEEERTEQAKLRGEYLKTVKKNFRRTLESIEITNESDKK